MICGDFNFDIDRLLNSDQLAAYRAFINGIEVAFCDVGNIIPGYTYRSVTGRVHSLIIFCSSSIFGNIKNVHIVDSGDNLSDHLPLMYKIHNVKLKSIINKSRANVQNKMMFKWDVHFIQRYRELTAFRLDDIFVPQCLYTGVNCIHSDHRILRDKYCNDIVNVLKTAASEAVSQYRLLRTFGNHTSVT